MSVYNGKSCGILLFESWHGKKNIGSSRIRGHWLINHWDEAEVFQQGAKYDVIIFQKAYWGEYVQNFDGIKILDICDPDWLETAPIKEVVDYCDAVVCSTEALRDEMRKFVKEEIPVVYIPDRQDLNFHNVQKEHKGRAKKVIWFGYSHNTKALDKTLGLLKKLELELTVLSNGRPPYLKADTNIKYEWENPAFDFNKIVLEHDIVLFPEDDRPVSRFKSDNKKYTAWALGMPVARTPDDLKRFMEPEERIKEAELKLKEVREKYDVRQSVQEYKELINQIINKKNESRR